MSKIKLLTLAVIGLFILNLATLAFLILNKPKRKLNEGPKNIIIEKLNFNPQQVKEYEILIAEHQQKLRTQQANLGKTKTEFYKLLNTNNNQLKDSLLNNITQIQKGIELIHYQHFEQLKMLCKPNQLSNFEALTNELALLFNRDKQPNKNNPPH